MRRQYSIASRHAWARGRSEPRGYMKHQSERSGPGSAARTAFPLNEVKALFEEGGEFNRVWWKKHQNRPAFDRCASVRPALEAEELGLEQVVWNRRAVDVDERPAPAGTPAMDGAGDQTFARARLSREPELVSPVSPSSSLP